MDMLEPEGVKDQHNPSVLHIRKKREREREEFRRLPRVTQWASSGQGLWTGFEALCHDAIPLG